MPVVIVIVVVIFRIVSVVIVPIGRVVPIVVSPAPVFWLVVEPNTVVESGAVPDIFIFVVFFLFDIFFLFLIVVCIGKRNEEKREQNFIAGVHN
jgi:hypothetical protein